MHAVNREQDIITVNKSMQISVTVAVERQGC